MLTQVLIGLLGEGIVKDMNDGRVFDVTEFIVVLTSNLGTGSADTIGIRSGEDPAQRIRRVIADNLPREILGRIDDLLVFSSLPDVVLLQIWDREVDALSQQLAAGQPAIQLQVAPDVSVYLLEQVRTQAAAEGARAVKKLFEREIAASCIDALERATGAGRLVLERAGATLNCRFEPEGQIQPLAQGINVVNLR